MFIVPVRVGLWPLIRFKLACKMATHLALFTAKSCSNLSLLHIADQCHLLQHHAAIFILASGGKTD